MDLTEQTEQELEERFEKAVNRLDAKLMRGILTQGQYDFMYRETVKEFFPHEVAVCGV